MSGEQLILTVAVNKNPPVHKINFPLNFTLGC